MPIYEYECRGCGRASSFLVRSTDTHRPPACPRCGGRKMHRLLSRFSAPGIRKGGVRASDGDADLMPDGADAEGSLDPAGMESMLDGLDGNDPRAMGRMMRRLSEQSGEPLDGELDEVTRRLEAGEDPDAIDERMGGSNSEDSGADTLYDG